MDISDLVRDPERGLVTGGTGFWIWGRRGGRRAKHAHDGDGQHHVDPEKRHGSHNRGGLKHFESTQEKKG